MRVGRETVTFMPYNGPIVNHIRPPLQILRPSLLTSPLSRTTTSLITPDELDEIQNHSLRTRRHRSEFLVPLSISNIVPLYIIAHLFIELPTNPKSQIELPTNSPSPISFLSSSSLISLLNFRQTLNPKLKDRYEGLKDVVC
ncbi:hypothetical protein QL285_048025 [Trifolium repens]|nr:hypothetical protein QL285_048025 [Trifolium repens]